MRRLWHILFGHPETEEWGFYSKITGRPEIERERCPTCGWSKRTVYTGDAKIVDTFYDAYFENKPPRA